MLDQGGKLYCNPEIQNLFRKFGYEVRCTGADASNQNEPVECAHRTVSNSVWALLFRSGLSAHFWPYAFNYVLRIQNALLHRGQDMSPIKKAHHQKDNFKSLKTFGCRIHVRLPGV